jgi:hypothetical protein
VDGTFHFVATARNISNHDCPARTGFAYWIEGPKPSRDRVTGWAIHGDFFGINLPPPWHPGEEERSEFDWQTKNQHREGQPVRAGDYVVAARFCPGPVDPQSGECAAIASTTVTVEPATTPSATPSPVP